MQTIQIGPNSRVITDEKSGAIRSWFDVTVPPQTDKAFTPNPLARGVLEESAKLFRWTPPLSDLKDGEVTQGPNTFSVRFTQEYKGVPVDASEVVVNLYTDSRVHSIYNNYHYDIPANLDPKKIKIDAARARAAAEKIAGHFERREISEPTLIVYQYRRIINHPKQRGQTDEPGAAP